MADQAGYFAPGTVTVGGDSITSVESVSVTPSYAVDESFYVDGFANKVTARAGLMTSVTITLTDLAQAEGIVADADACTSNSITFRLKGSCGASDRLVTVTGVSGWVYDGSMEFSHSAVSRITVRGAGTGFSTAVVS